MKIYNLFLKFILPLFTCFLSLAAVIIGSISLAKVYEEPDIGGFIDSKFFDTYVDNLYVKSNYNNRLNSANFQDKELIEEVQSSFAEAMRFATFKKVSDRGNTESVDCIVFSWFDENGNPHNDYIELAVVQNNNSRKLRVRNHNRTVFYYSDCTPKVDWLIRETAKKVFSDTAE